MNTFSETHSVDSICHTHSTSQSLVALYYCNCITECITQTTRSGCKMIHNISEYFMHAYLAPPLSSNPYPPLVKIACEQRAIDNVLEMKELNKCIRKLSV